MPVSENQKKHARRGRRRANKDPMSDTSSNQAECICQDLLAMLEAKVAVMEKTEHKCYEAVGICICPEHGRNEFESYYARNLRGGCDMEGTRQNGKLLGYIMH